MEYFIMIGDLPNSGDSIFYLAGVIPISGLPLDYDMPWHDSLIPLAPNYLAVERAVMECVYAGCETVWLVGKEGDTPIIRYRIGDFVVDPLSTIYYDKKDFYKNRSIFYVPVNAKDFRKRDSLSYSVIRGVKVAHKVSTFLSGYYAPDKFYIAWPYGVYPPEHVQPFRPFISHKKPFFMRYDNKTVKDDEYLSFTMSLAEAKQCNLDIWKRGVGRFKPGEEYGTTMAEFPVEERYSARRFGPGEVFSSLTEEEANYGDLEWYHNISNFGGYRSFMASQDYLERPKKKFFGYKEWNLIALDEEDKEDYEDHNSILPRLRKNFKRGNS
jgi:hypothetical protein